MEDYIFIIIAIVLSVIGALNSKKKKRMQLMGNDEKPPERQPSIFDQFFDDPLFTEPSTATVPPQTTTFAPTKMEVKPMPRTFANREVTAHTTKRKIKTSFTEDEIKDETTRESILSDFSIKKAIIYSEILKRKY